MSVESEARSGRPSTSPNEEMIGKVHQILMKDVVVITRLLPRDGGMAEEHGAPESRQLLRA